MVLRASLHYGTHAAYLYKEDLSSTRILDKWHQIALCKPSNTASDTSRSFEERNILLFLKHLWSQKKCKIYLWSVLMGSRPLPTCLFQVFSPTGKGEYESTFADSLLRLILMWLVRLPTNRPTHLGYPDLLPLTVTLTVTVMVTVVVMRTEIISTLWMNW